MYSKKSLADANCFLLISYFWQRKNIPKKFGKHHRDYCCLLYAIRNVPSVPMGCSDGPTVVGSTEQHWKILKLKKNHIKHSLIFIKL